MRASGGSGLSHVAPFQTASLLLWVEFADADVELDIGVETAISRDPLHRELTQATDGSQPPHTADDYQTNDHNSISLNGHHLQSTEAASVWNHHGAGDIAGLLAGIPGAGDGNLYGTVVGPAGEGWQIRLDTGEIRLRIENSAAGVTTLAVPYESGVPTTIRWYIGAAGTAQLEAQGQVATASGITLSSSGAPETTLRIGDAFGGDTGKWNLFILWADEDADSNLRAEYYARDKFWCELGITEQVAQHYRSDRGVTLGTPPQVTALADQNLDTEEDLAPVGGDPVVVGNAPYIGGRRAIEFGTGNADLSAATGPGNSTVIWTGAMRDSGGGPMIVWEGADTDAHVIGVHVNGSGNWGLLVVIDDVDVSIDSGVAADTDTHTFILRMTFVGEIISLLYELVVDGSEILNDVINLEDPGPPLDTFYIGRSPLASSEANFGFGRYCAFAPLSAWAELVATWAQRKWAGLAQLPEAPTLLELAASEGAMLFCSVLDPSGYALSGSTFTSIEEQIQGDTIAVAGNPQFSATGFNGGPGAVHDGAGDWFIGTNATIVAALQTDEPLCLIIAGKLDDLDATAAFFGAGDSTVAGDSTRMWGQSAAGSGRFTARFVDDGGTLAFVNSPGATDTDPHVHRIIHWGNGTASWWIDGTLIIDEAAIAPGTTTVDQWGIFCRPDSAADNALDGAWAVMTAFPDTDLHAAVYQAVADAVGVTLS